MALIQSVKILCLFIVLGISTAGGIPAPGPLPPDDIKYYCSSLYSECPEVCPDIYEPVCAKYQPQCGHSYCPPIYKTYPSGCNACQDENVIYYTQGPCEEHCKECEEEEEYEEECEEEEEEYEEEEEECECEEEEEYEEECEEEEEKKYCKVNPGISVHCTQDYNPVCGYFEDCPNGVCYETYSNSCEACYYGCVDYYIDGVCPEHEKM